MTAAHGELIGLVAHGPTSTWSQWALRACMDRLSTSTLTEAGQIRVERAWADGDTAFCVIYRALHDSRKLIGVRRDRANANQDDHHAGGLFSGTELEMPDDDPDPEEFGKPSPSSTSVNRSSRWPQL